MKINIRRICGTFSAVVVLIAAGILAIAAPASARPAPQSVIPAMTGTTTPFDLNGIYTDLGSARPWISDVNDILTIDMSSQNRPTATGFVIDADTIWVTFPDDPHSPYTGRLVSPGTINWSNNSVWKKLAIVVVPDVIDLPKAQAIAAVQSAGLNPVVQSEFSCDTVPGRVVQQLPAAGAQTVPGALVQIFIAVKPKTCT